MWTVVQYQDPQGSTPIRDELARIYKKHGKGEATAIKARLKVVIDKHVQIQHGPLQPTGSAFHRVEEFWQIRSNDVRILLCYSENTSETLVMLHAFEKYEKNTPPSAIKTARNIHQEYRKHPKIAKVE